MKQIFTPDLKLSDIIDMDYNLVQVISRMGIDLRHAGLPASEACALDGIDPASFLLPETPHTYSTFVWQQNTYRTRNQAVNFRLIPLYDVLDEPYTVCFSALTPLSGK